MRHAQAPPGSQSSRRAGGKQDHDRRSSQTSQGHRHLIFSGPCLNYALDSLAQHEDQRLVHQVLRPDSRDDGRCCINALSIRKYTHTDVFWAKQKEECEITGTLCRYMDPILSARRQLLHKRSLLGRGSLVQSARQANLPTFRTTGCTRSESPTAAGEWRLRRARRTSSE